MLIISNESQWLEITEDVAYQQVLFAVKIGGKRKNMTMLLKQD